MAAAPAGACRWPLALGRRTVGEPISVHEFLYPLSQAYDSVAIQSDLEIGGTDQKFNLLVGREVMRSYGHAPQCILTMPILEGTDGVEKMSKSLGNYIGVTDSPKDIFGKTMSIPDTMLTRYLTYACFASTSEVAEVVKGLKDGSLHPRNVKVDIAKRVVEKYHSLEAADEAFVEFERVFVKKDMPDEIEERTLDLPAEAGLIDILHSAGMVESKSAARRLIQQGGVKVDGEKVTDPMSTIDISTPRIVRAGKLKFLKVVSS